MNCEIWANFEPCLTNTSIVFYIYRTLINWFKLEVFTNTRRLAVSNCGVPIWKSIFGTFRQQFVPIWLRCISLHNKYPINYGNPGQKQIARVQNLPSISGTDLPVSHAERQNTLWKIPPAEEWELKNNTKLSSKQNKHFSAAAELP